MSCYRLPQAALAEIFAVVRRCGGGRNECQALWIGPWAEPDVIARVVHPSHRAHNAGFELEGEWLTRFWIELAGSKSGVRAQVHTHPGRAFHSATDDAWPMVHTPGFLSLVIPCFGLGPIGLDGTFLAELGRDGQWREVDATQRLKVV